MLPLGGLAFAGSRAVQRALPRHDFGHRLIDRHVLIGRQVLVAPRRATGSAFLTADAVATALIGRLARRLLAIRPALAPGRRFLLGVAITAAPVRVRTAAIVPTLVAKTLPPPPPSRLVIDIARRGCASSSSSAAAITRLSHSPTDVPDRRAAARAISRPSGPRPLSFHVAPDFIRVQPTS